MAHEGDGLHDLVEAAVLVGCESEPQPTQQRPGVVISKSGIEGVGLVDTDYAIPTIGSKSNCPCGNEDMRICGHEYGHICMPLWSISMVELIGEGSLESINIPRDVQSDQLHIEPKIRFVRADDALELMKNIAGLREVAVKRAREARDLITKYRQHMDALLSHRTAELIALRKKMVEYRARQETEHLGPIREAINKNGIGGGIRTLDGADELDLESLVGKTSPRIDREEVGDQDRPQKVRKVRHYRSLSDGPANIIYGSWKMTKSE